MTPWVKGVKRSIQGMKLGMRKWKNYTQHQSSDFRVREPP